MIVNINKGCVIALTKVFPKSFPVVNSTGCRLRSSFDQDYFYGAAGCPHKKLQLKDVRRLRRELLLARLLLRRRRHCQNANPFISSWSQRQTLRCHQLRWFCKSRVKDIELCYDKKMTTVRGGLSIQGQFGNSFLH